VGDIWVEFAVRIRGRSLAGVRRLPAEDAGVGWTGDVGRRGVVAFGELVAGHLGTSITSGARLAAQGHGATFGQLHLPQRSRQKPPEEQNPMSQVPPGQSTPASQGKPGMVEPAEHAPQEMSGLAEGSPSLQISPIFGPEVQVFTQVAPDP
jgi:hypothetical protein